MRDIYEVTGEFTNQKIDEFWNMYYDDNDDYEDIIDYLNEAKNFRTFDAGLTEFIKKHGYVEKEGLSDEVCLKQRVNFLKQKLKEKNIHFVDVTLKNHFEGQIRPEVIESNRKNIFKLCFAMDLDVDETTAFFNKIYFDRTFNVKNIDELVYYFCIKNKKSFNYAEELIEKIKKMLAEDCSDILDEIVYTSAIHEKTDFFTEEAELIRYVLENKNAFNRYNTTAIRELNQLLDRIQGKKEDKKILTRIQKANVITSQDYEDIKKCGLVVQDIFKNYAHDIIKPKNNEDDEDKEKNKARKDSIIKNLSVHSIDFMLFVIYSSNKPVGNSDYSFKNDAKLLNIIKNNFPAKSKFSRVKKDPHYSSDALRKMLILLEFYAFCFDASETEDEYFDFFDDFKEQMNDILDSCGMGPLYIGNPYDWLFLYCAKCTNPLDVFRSIINEVCELDDEF